MSRSSDAALAMRTALQLEKLPVVFCRQQHTDRIHVIRDAGELRFENPSQHVVIDSCDGLITCVAGLALAIFTADCVPIVFIEAARRIVGVVHAGWRGTYAQIALRALEKITQLDGQLANVWVWLGPAIGGCCYEIGEELANDFAKRFQHLASLDGAFLSGRYLDLIQLNRLQLISAGIPGSHIKASGICTKHSLDRFYSYRAEGEQAGRIVTMIARTE
jgi:YfiH family protein